MASTKLSFASKAEHRRWIATQAILPAGFQVGTTRFSFTPAEAPKPAAMNLTVIAPEVPTPAFAAVFTKNAFPGAPVLVGRRRLAEPTLGAIVVNNKVSNVRAPDGEASAERVCAAVAKGLGLSANQVIPSSTGVIGWRIPVDTIVAAAPDAVASVGKRTLAEAAEAILTTDLYPKVRRVPVGNGSIVGIAKGAGMVEPNMATMLVYLMTDLMVPRETLRRLLPIAVAPSFNCISVDSDMSTSDTVVLLSSGKVPCPDETAFAKALSQVCADLAEDVVRNGEGVRHVVRATVKGAPTAQLARAIGKSIINAPLFKCAVTGNDPNVGRILMAIGKYVGNNAIDLDLSNTTITLGGLPIYQQGSFQLDGEKEAQLVAHMKSAELYQSAPPKGDVFHPAVDYPTHERCVELEVDLGRGQATATVLGADLTHEYVSENADYRS